jgi:hypothetical protein
MRYWFSTIGLLIGFLAIGLAAFQDHFVVSAPPVENNRSWRELASDTGKKFWKERVLKEEPAKVAARRPAPFHPVRVVYTTLGLVAISLGTLSWIKKEHIRMSGGAVALGLVAICWQWVLIGVCIAFIIFLLANLGG